MAPRLISTQRHTHLQPEYLLRSAKTRVGRHPDNDVVVMLESISRFHAEFENQDDAIMLRDLGSRNGTYLNGHRVQTSVPVRHGDRVQFGNVEFVFRSADLSEEAVKQGTITNVTLVKSRRLPMELVSSKTLHALADELAGAKTPAGRNNLVFELYQICLWLRENTREISEVLPELLDRVVHVVKASRAAVLLRTEGGDLEPIAWLRRKDRRDETSPSIQIPQSITEASISECRAVLMGDPATDERFKHSDSIVELRITSAICVPLVVRKAISGIIYIDNQGRTTDPLTDIDLAFVGSVAQELAFAMEVRSGGTGTTPPPGESTGALAPEASTIVGAMAETFARIAQADDAAIEKMTVALEDGNIADARTHWRPLRRTLKRVEAMVQEMHDFARPFKPRSTQVQINDVIRDTLDTFAQDAKAKGIDIRANLSADAGSAMLDEEAIYKTLLGLLLNACDAVASGGTIEVKSATLPAGGLLVAVSDNGPGLPPDVRARLFEPFNTGPGSRGTGMGLALAHRYVEAMGGTMDVDSVEGRGTRVEIKFSAAVRSKTAATY